MHDNVLQGAKMRSHINTKNTYIPEHNLGSLASSLLCLTTSCLLTFPQCLQMTFSKEFGCQKNLTQLHFEKSKIGSEHPGL